MAKSPIMPVSTAIEILGGAIAHAKANPGSQLAYFVAGLARELQLFNEGAKNVSRKTYVIELKINFDDDKRHEHALTMMRRSARTILTQAAMLADNRPPEVALRTEDLFEGTDDLKLQEEQEEQEKQG